MAWNKDSIIRLATVDSTNRYTRDDADNLWNKHGENGFVVITATHQTAGRGQRGNIWSSNAGENLLISILVRPGEALEVKRQFLLSQAVALAMHDAMLHYDIDTRLKWPNDIYVGNRKLAGILLELDYAGRYVEQAIIGIGLNVNQQAFPPMDRVPVSMKMLWKAESGKLVQASGRKFIYVRNSRSQVSSARSAVKTENGKQRQDLVLDDVLSTLLCSFERYYNLLLQGHGDEIAAEYDKLLLGINEQHTFIDKDGPFEAVLQGVESDGHLLLQCNDGCTGRYAFKEVEMVL